MKIFWSWQSDTPPKLNKHFIRAALAEAIDQVAQELDLSEADRPELDHDTQGVPGLVSIVDTIFSKIEAATVFVGDVTFVGETPSQKRLPNPNVMIELGHAITSLTPSRIILVSNAAYGARPEDLPFDLRHRRGPITYTLTEAMGAPERKAAQAKLVRELALALRSSLGDALEARAAEIAYPMHPARPGDRSIWLPPGEKLRHHGFFGDAAESEWAVVEAPRSYLRIIPASYRRTLSVRDAHQLSKQSEFLPLGPWGGADGGANEHGIVAVGTFRDAPDAIIAAAQWFIDTGEIWGFNAAASFQRDKATLLAYGSIPKEWLLFMRRAWQFLDRIGITGPFKVEAGIVGLKQARWPTEMGTYSALRDEVHWTRTDTRWDEESRLEYLCALFNQLADAYNQPWLSLEEYRARYGRP